MWGLFLMMMKTLKLQVLDLVSAEDTLRSQEFCDPPHQSLKICFKLTAIMIWTIMKMTMKMKLKNFQPIYELLLMSTVLGLCCAMGMV